MFFAQLTAAPPFFPPWYFWLFVLATVISVLSFLALIVYLNLSADTERLRHERETAARLVEVMLVQRKMSPEEIEQVLASYGQMNTFWNRVRRYFSISSTSSKPDLTRNVGKADTF
jgi:hypothetical protein